MDIPTYPQDTLLPPRLRHDLLLSRAKRLNQTTEKEESEMMNETPNESNETALPRAVIADAEDATPVDSEAEEAQTVTLESLHHDLETARLELSGLQAEQARVNDRLRQAFDAPESLDPGEITALRTRGDELSLSLRIAALKERQSQLDFYLGLLDDSQRRFAPLIAERERASAALFDAQNRHEEAQNAAGACQQDITTYRQLCFRVQGEIAAARSEFQRSLSKEALRAQLPPRQDLMQSVNAELAQFAARGGKL